MLAKAVELADVMFSMDLRDHRAADLLRLELPHSRHLRRGFH